MLNNPAELYLGSDATTAMTLGARRFGSAAKAVRFAMEQAAPVSLRGASLRVGTLTFGPHQIRALHDQIAKARLTLS
ncbi:hypothetical protein VE26_00310 [Devosia chinhatensis]|uniref:Uncharacterized protein n=1 Tax=Devosia chinhatensis TaxID=429727 RepID=A0A0F5FNM9_9HYPH|nr:hypothetical protein VE26_00310 [Devosia chinhatensis]